MCRGFQAQGVFKKFFSCNILKVERCLFFIALNKSLTFTLKVMTGVAKTSKDRRKTKNFLKAS